MRKSIYKINSNYFSNQSPNMAYIIGFLAADGNLSSKDNRIDLELSSLDLEILEKIRLELELEREIKIYHCASGYIKNKLYFYDAQIKKDLMEYGLCPNKTYSDNYLPPYKLNQEYWIDYIRGFFDGDGSIGDCNHTPRWYICGSKKIILEEIQQFLQNNFNIITKFEQTPQKRKIEIYRLYCYGDSTREIYKILYTPNSLYLKRKKDKFEELI